MNVHGRLRAAARRHPHADVAVAVVVYVVTLVTTAAGPSGRALDVAAIVTAALACGALALQHRYPATVLAVSAAAAEAYLVHFQGQHGSLILAAPLIALYTVAESARHRHAPAIGVVAVLAFAGLHMLVKPASWLGAENLALAALGGLAVAAGNASRNRHAYLAEVEARAHHAEADRHAEAVRRVTEERLRIARDLHDAVGHHLALIYVQAGVATHVLTAPPDQAREALAHIRTASKTALGELSDTIGLLRQPDEPAAPTDPIVGLAGVDELVTTFRNAGLRIAQQIDGQVRPVAVSTDLTAYRIIQESLTNVRKHAGPTAVDLRLSYRPETLRIVVDNAMPAQTPHSGDNAEGHGLVGMRERAAALGGSVHAGPRPDGGYRVAAILPLATGSQT